MRLVLNGNTQLLYTLMVGIEPSWPHVNVHQCQLFFPTAALEAGNAGASVKIGGAGLTTTLADMWDFLEEGDRKFIPSQGDGMNRVGLKTIYVRGSANNTILIVEPHIG